MQHPALTAAAMAATLVSFACNGGSGPGDQHYDPPNTEFAGALGITPPPPVTPEQAMAIAEEATGGTATSVDQETEGGELLYEVQVSTSSGGQEVEIRASDGGVVEIEAADDD